MVVCFLFRFVVCPFTGHALQNEYQLCVLMVAHFCCLPYNCLFLTALPLALLVVFQEVAPRRLDAGLAVLQRSQRRNDRVEHARRGVLLVDRRLEVVLLRKTRCGETMATET